MTPNFGDCIVYKTSLLTQIRYSAFFADQEDHRSLQVIDVYYPSMETIGARVGKNNSPSRADANRRALDLSQVPSIIVDKIDFAIQCRLHGGI